MEEEFLTCEAAVAGEAATNEGGNASVAADAADAKKASEDAAAAASHIGKQTNLNLGDTLNDLYRDVLSSPQPWTFGI